MGQKRYAWLTGDTPPSPEELCRSVSVPSDLPLVTAITGALLPLTNPDNWQQHGTMTPEEAAEIMSAALDAFLSSTCGGDCPPVQLPDGNRIYRRNPTTKRFEYIDPDTGEWVEPSGDETLPTPTPRAETTLDERLCAAATNAVHCLKVTLEAVLDEWEAFSPPAQAITTMVTGIVGWAGAAFYPPMLAYVLLVEAAFNLFYEMMDAISWNFWDTNFEGALICSLKSNATETGGVITFDYDAVVSDLWAQLWTRGEYVLLVTQVQYLLWVIGPQGLDIAGTTTALAGNCASCGTWCMEWTSAAGTLQNGQWTIFEGAPLQSGEVGWVYYSPAWDGAYRRIGFRMENLDLSSTVIKSMWADVYKPTGGQAYLYFDATNSTGFNTPTFQNFATANGWKNTGLEAGDRTNGTSTTLTVRFTSNDALGWLVRKLRLMGTGVNPFGASNCS